MNYPYLMIIYIFYILKDRSKSIREIHSMYFILLSSSMKTILIWIALVLFGFMMGVGVGFKVFEGISGDLIAEAWDNSYKQFQTVYPGSSIQRNTDAIIAQKKEAFIQEIKDNFSDYVLKMLKSESKTNN